MHGLSLQDARDARTGTARSPRACTTTPTTSRARRPSRCRPPAAGGAGRIADQSGTGWRALALRGTWRPRRRRRAHRRSRLSGRRLSRCGRSSSNTERLARRRGRPRASRRFAATPSSRACTRRTAGVRARLARDARRARRALARRRTARSANATSDARRSPSAARHARLAEARARLAAHARLDAQGVAGSRRAHADGRRALPGLDRRDSIVNNDPESRAREILDRRAHRANASSATACCAPRCFFEDTRDALYSQTNVTVVPNVTSIQNVDQIRTRGLEIACQAQRRARRRARALGQRDLRALAHRRERQLPGERRASGSRACPSGAPTRSRRIASANAGRRRSARATAARSTTRSTIPIRTPFSFTGTSPFLVFDTRVR